MIDTTSRLSNVTSTDDRKAEIPDFWSLHGRFMPYSVLPHSCLVAAADDEHRLNLEMPRPETNSPHITATPYHQTPTVYIFPCFVGPTRINVSGISHYFLSSSGIFTCLWQMFFSQYV